VSAVPLVAALVAVLVAVAVLAWPSGGRVGDRLEAASVRLRQPGAAGPGPRSSVGWPAQGGRLRELRPGSSGRSPGLERELLTLLEGLAGTLRAGLTPARAFAHLAATADLGRSTAAGRLTSESARRLGSDPRPGPLDGLLSRLAAQATTGARLEPIWRAAAERTGSPALLAVAEGWGLSERHGAPVAAVLDALVVALRDGARTDAAIETSLAAPRATAALLGVLPLGGVVLGELVGVHPLTVLVTSPAGRVAGAAGLVATLGGRLWMHRLVRSVGAR
jgi:hypothetical protein